MALQPNQPKTRNSFPKSQRLCSVKAIDELYSSGQPFLAYPLRCVFRTVEASDEVIRVLISAPKRNHKRAVVRNLLKRRVREAYRLNRSILAENLLQGVFVEFSISYIAKEVLEYKIIEDAVKKILAELGNRLAAAAR